MKLSYNEILNEINPSIQVLLQTDTKEVDLKLLSVLVSNSETIEAVSKTHGKLRMAIIKKFANLKEDGEPKTYKNEEGDMVYDVDSEKKKDFIEKLEELSNKKTDVKLEFFKEEDFSKFVAFKPIFFKFLKVITK